MNALGKFITEGVLKVKNIDPIQLKGALDEIMNAAVTLYFVIRLLRKMLH